MRMMLKWSVGAVFGLGLGAALAAFPDDPPNDPGWATQYNLRGGNVGVDAPDPGAEFPLATDAAGSSGMAVDLAWREGREALGEAALGRPDVVIAYMEGGFNWHASSFGPLVEDLIPNLHLNRAEIRGSARFADCAPENPDQAIYRAADFAGCVPDANGNGVVDPEDVILYFADGLDQDGNGYPDDISGFDFYNRQPNPATVDQAQVHANTQIQKGMAVADNGAGLAGVCPRCAALPVKLAAESLGRTNEMAEAVLYTLDAGLHGWVSETADLGYSSFMRQAMRETWNREWTYTDALGREHSVRGIPSAMTTNNFNSTDHQGGMYWPHTLPCNSVVADTAGLPDTSPLLPPNSTATTFRRKSANNSWGTRYWVALSTRAGTTSETCGTALGLLGLLQSWSLEATDRGLIEAPLSAAEIMQLLARSADPIGPGDDVGWPVKDGWDRFTGYGRINMRRAQQLIIDNDIPPQAWFESPRWFSLYDPTKGGEIVVEGHVSAPRAESVDWVLEWALGPEPEDAEFQTLATGNTAREGELGRLPLTAIPEAFYRALFQADDNRFEAVKQLPSTERYTVTFRLRATDSAGRLGEERRTVFAQHDPNWLPAFPFDTGSAGVESGVVFADLQGRGSLAVIFADMDGVLRALDPVTGESLPGWPATLDPTETVADHRAKGIDPGFEPVPNPIAVGDLDGDGRLSVVVTSSTGKVYVFDENGARRPGWPRALNVGVEKPAMPRPPVPFLRPTIQGAFSSPVLDDLDGDGRLDVIQAGWDGHLHVWNADGEYLPGWPVLVRVPDSTPLLPGYLRFQDYKLSTTPAVADLNGDGRKEIVLRSQMADATGAGEAPLPQGHALAYDLDGQLLPGWPVKMLGVLIVHGTSQEFITEGSNSPIAADLDGDGAFEVAINPVFSAASYVYDGNGRLTRAYGAVPLTLPALQLPPAVSLGGIPTLGGLVNTLTELLTPFADPLAELPVIGPTLADTVESTLDLPAGIGSLPDFPVTFTTSAAFGRFGLADQLSFAQPGSNVASMALSLLPKGFGTQIVNVDRVHDAVSGVPLPGFPAVSQGLNFLGSPLFADVTGDGRREMIAGGDSSALQAFTDLGQPAAGFAKFHTGWTLWAPSVGDADSDGAVEIAQGTREGYVMIWRTPGRASANTEWWRFRANEWNNGRYGADTRPPGVLRELAARDDGALQFTAPGDDWYSGQVDHYRLLPESGGEPLILAATAAAGARETLQPPPGLERGFVQAVDEAGNVSRLQGYALSGTAPVPYTDRGGLDGSGRGLRGGGAMSALALLLLLLARGFGSVRLIWTCPLQQISPR